MKTRRLLPFALVLLLAAACGKDSKGGGPPPPQPFTGAPVAFEVTKLTPPQTVEVRAYNFSDKTFATYSMLIRYYDKDGKTVLVKPGTPFEEDYDFYSVSGRRYLAKPKSWISFEVDFEIPEGAVKAEMLLDSVTAVKADGMNMEEDPTWKLETRMEWPTAPAK